MIKASTQLFVILKSSTKKCNDLFLHSVDSLHLGLWTYDIKNHRIILGNNSSTMELRQHFCWPSIFENAPESTYNTIAERDLPQYIKMFEEVNAGHDASCEVWYSDVSGMEPICEREAYHVLFDEDGKPSLAYGVGQNITADRKVKERYTKELEFLRTNNEAGLIAKGHYNLSRNLVLEYENLCQNKASQPVAGGSFDDFIELLISQAYQEQDRIVIREQLSRKNLIKRYQEGQMQLTLQYHKKFNDDPFCVSLTIHTYIQPQTNDLELFSYAYDITENKLIESIMGIISDHTFDYIAIIDASKKTMELIRKSKEITFAEVRVKIPVEQVTADVKNNYISEDEQKRYEEISSLDHILKVLKESGKYTSTYLIQKDNRIRCKQVDFLWLDEAQERILAVRTDVTDAYIRDQQYLNSLQLAKLDAERANEEKSTFLSSMSHDMRTPLNGIISYTNFAIKEDDPLRKQDYLNKVAESGKLLLDLVDETLELSRIESGKVTLEPESFELKEMIAAIVTSIQPAAEAKKIKLTIDLDGQMNALLWGDRRKIQKILLNLLSNSIKYTHAQGTVGLKTSIANDSAPTAGFIFEIEDTGIGMSKEFMKRMYEPFSQEKRSESAETPGTGLGLSIVKKYTDLMEGTIEVESVIHEGTKWKIFLPIVKADVREKMDWNDIPEIILKGKRILLCEDNYMNTEIALVLLKDKGILTDTAGNGKEGVCQFMESPEGYYDAILMDIQMPVMNGYDAVKKIRSLPRTDAKQIPIVAMSADVFEESIRTAKDVGMNGYITKPVDPEHMFRELYRVMKHAE